MQQVQENKGMSIRPFLSVPSLFGEDAEKECVCILDADDFESCAKKLSREEKLNILHAMQ